MSYIPPHKRLDSSSSRPTPVVPPFFGRGNRNQSNYSNRGGFKPDLVIKYGRNSIRKWFPVGEGGDQSDVLLEFQPFEGESFEHLRDEKLYTLSVIPRHVRDVADDLGLLAVEETCSWRYICEKIKKDFKDAYNNVLSAMEMVKPGDVKPTFVVRFGRVLFHGDGLAWDASIKSESVEKALKGEKGIQSALKKTFETNIPENVFDALKEKIIVGLETQKLKDKYLIQVEDKLHPGFLLHLKCCKSSADETMLELKEIELASVRHLVADVSCFNKPMDLRLILTTKNYWAEEENVESIERIVKSASIEGSAKGGLHWPLGGDSEGNRFSVKGAWHRDVTSIVGESCKFKFKFQRANRAEFKASSGRITSEISLKLKSVTKYLRDQRQWEEENVMNELENVLKWVWTECLECDKLVHKHEH